MYDFKQLSPADFEELTRDLLQRHWGVTLEAFKKGRDRGIDLRYAQSADRAVVIQCKHWVGSTVTKLIHHLATEEVAKVARLNPSRYLLVTSLPLNPDDKDKIRAALHPYIQSTGDIVGPEGLNGLLAQYREIEEQNYKLWLSSTAVLERVLHNAEHVQTEFDVARVQRRIPLYVQNTSYPRAMKILEDSRFVVISGVPGIGKTTLADMLLFAHLEAGYQPVVIKAEIAEGKRKFNPEKRQIFYFDDFLGQTFLGSRFDFLGRKEDSAILDFIDMVAGSKQSKLILTTREHILQHAYQISERFHRQRADISSGQCILELKDYRLIERGRILYNHIYFSDLPSPYKAALLTNQFYMKVLKHRNFNPRLVEWLSRYTNLKTIDPSNYSDEIERVLENPEQLWRIAFEQQISESSRTILLALYSLGGNAHLNRLQSVWRSLHQYRSKKYNWSTSAEDWRNSLQELEGGFLKFERFHAQFVNPSVKDFLDTKLVSDRDHLDDLLSAVVTFEQIDHIWALVRSDKGASIQKEMEISPARLMEAVNKNLANPHEEKEMFSGGGYAIRTVDTRPETRLRTIISMAYRTRSKELLGLVAQYSQNVISFWKGHAVDASAAVVVLSALDRVKWPQLKKLDLHGQLKTALLANLETGAGSGDLSALVGYADDDESEWTEDDGARLKNYVHAYFAKEFDQEVADCDSESSLSDLGDSAEGLASYAGIDFTSYQMTIDEHMERFREREDDDDERPTRNWEGSGVGQQPEYMQEIEVTRIFDGLEP